MSSKPIQHLARTLLHDRGSRRKLMFVFTAALLLATVLGSFVLDAESSPALFVGGWLVVLLGCFFLAGLSLYDILVTFREGRAAARKLREEMAEAVPDSNPSNPSDD